MLLIIKKLSECFEIFLVVYVLFCLFFAGAGMVYYLCDVAERKTKPLRVTNRIILIFNFNFKFHE